MPQPFSLAMNSPSADLPEIGKQFLMSGKVSPEEVKAAMGLVAPPPRGTASLLTQGEGEVPDETSPWAGAAPAAGVVTEKGMKKQTTKTDKNTEENKMSQTRNTYLDPDSFKGLTDTIEGSDAFQQQKKGIDDSEALLKMSMQKDDPDDPQAWLKPLSAYVDSTFGSKISQGLPAQQPAGAKQAGYMNAMDDLQKRKGDLSKAVLEGVTKLKSGSDTNQQNQMLMNQIAQIQGNMGGGRYGDPEDRMAFQAHQANLRALKKDTIMNKSMNNFNNIQNAVNNTIGVDKLTIENFAELQQAIRSSIANGSGGVEERAKTYYQSLGMDATHFMQWLESKPKSLSKNDPFVKHVLQIATKELGNLQKQNQTRSKFLLGGNMSMYNDPKYANYKADLDEMNGATTNMFTPQLDPKVADHLPKKKGGMSTPPQASAAPDDLNTDLSKLTPEQLTAWMAKHGGAG